METGKSCTGTLNPIIPSRPEQAEISLPRDGNGQDLLPEGPVRPIQTDAVTAKEQVHFVAGKIGINDD
jgi:hypothetical protein